MSAALPDPELIQAYARNGQESAFQALVHRHVNLVYATAFRQVGDAGLAEEITQNVFVALARKAPRLAGFETVAGWLHRTALLESKARIRAELRRRRREDTASQMTLDRDEGSSPFAALLPLLDEALLHLRESDRLALVLRYLEERPLREVGLSLGVDEDAARKRVDRALDRLTEFFRERGFAVPAASSLAALLAGSSQAAPAALTASATASSLAAASSIGVLNSFLIQFMALTKTQTAVVCGLLAASPLLWQWQTSVQAARELGALTNQLAQTRLQASALNSEFARLRDDQLRSEVDLYNSKLRLEALEKQRDGQAPIPVYRWDDSSPYARVPKSFLTHTRSEAVKDKRGNLTEQIKEGLQMNSYEAQTIEQSLQSFLEAFHAAQAKGVRPVQPAENELKNQSVDEIRVFEVPSIGEELPPLRARLFAEMEAVLGGERSTLLKRSLENWMPVDDQPRGMGSGMAVMNFDHRAQFKKPAPGDNWLGWGITTPHGSIHASMKLDDIPAHFRAALQDWIALAQSQPQTP